MPVIVFGLEDSRGERTIPGRELYPRHRVRARIDWNELDDDVSRRIRHDVSGVPSVRKHLRHTQNIGGELSVLPDFDDDIYTGCGTEAVGPDELL